jgi:hypothetical protein
MRGGQNLSSFVSVPNARKGRNDARNTSSPVSIPLSTNVAIAAALTVRNGAVDRD